MSGKEVVVTGGAGFLGSHLADLLIQNGYRVKVFDNLAMGKIENIAHLLPHPNFSFINGDVKDCEAVKTSCAHADVIFHLAAFKIPRYGNSMETLITNSSGMKNVLDVAAENKAKVIITSTSDVYGKNNTIPFNEESNCVYGPSTVRRWAYAVSKLFDEHLCYAYQETYAIPITICRIFGSYGPRQHLSWWGGPQSVFIDAILDGKPVEIHGDGSQTRSFSYVSDTVRGIFSTMECEKANGEIINIGNSDEISILELARLIKRLSGTPGELDCKIIPYSTFGNYEDVKRRVPDTSKAHRILGFEAVVGLDEGLTRTIEWQKQVKTKTQENISLVM